MCLSRYMDTDLAIRELLKRHGSAVVKPGRSSPCMWGSTREQAKGSKEQEWHQGLSGSELGPQANTAAEMATEEQGNLWKSWEPRRGSRKLQEHRDRVKRLETDLEEQRTHRQLRCSCCQPRKCSAAETPLCAHVQTLPLMPCVPSEVLGRHIWSRRL